MSQAIHLKTQIDCSPASAFRAFTDPAVLRQWLCLDANVQLQLGGSYELFWDLEDRNFNSTIGCVITVLEPDRLLGFDWKSPKQFSEFANNADPLTHVVVSFFSYDDGCHLHLIHSGWRFTPDWQEAREWQETAWRTALNRLQNHPRY